MGLLSINDEDLYIKIVNNDVYQYDVDVPIEKLVERFSPKEIIVKSIETYDLDFLKEKGIKVKETRDEFVKDIIPKINYLREL